ncbi:MAG: serine/threonine protein kinase [Chitinophagaceae bacterium]|nr:serine/threonine protein kinase [Bacteroidota bacterium]MCC6258877.1 serine/threonine protein kinase [Chitinophagaceae bacterium]MCW5916784.1 serine/threonine protein kinase [Ferruginibacter sp.]
MAYVSSTPDEVDGYKLQERIGSGGMGEVYKAYNPSLHRWAAIKILHQENFIERFKNEATIQASTNHPNIARLYAFSKIGRRDCIIMEYVEGDSLDTLLKRKGKLQAEEVRSIIFQIAAALAYLHKKEIVHRDIKPQNIKIQPDGTLKMLDFGIAKHKLSPKLTQAGFVVGTMEYLAPEQLAHKPELKSDMWALGVLSYEIATGYLPFESSTLPGLQEKIRKGSFTNPEILVPEIPQDICRVIDKCLRINPDLRASAWEVTKILEMVESPREEPIRFMNFISQNRKWILLASGIVLMVLLLLVFNSNSFYQWKSRKDSNEKSSFENKKGGMPEQEQEPNAIAPPATLPVEGVWLSTPGINNTQIIFPDGSKQDLPFQLKGKEGDNFELTIHADGYNDKKIQVEITPRRSSYEYYLDKSDK